MRWLVLILPAAIVGLATGAMSALWMGGLLPGGPSLGNGVNIDAWQSDWSIGSQAANPYVRARIARHGLLALRKEEAVYFTRDVDGGGQPLREACSYRVAGGRFPAEWWSITLYDADSRLPMNEDGALSFDATDAAELGEPDAWSFVVSAERGDTPERQWVSSHAGGVFDLTLRLYLPNALLLEDPGAVLQPPSIERLGCKGDA